MNLTEFTPPHSVEAEQAILGGLMLDNESWDLIADVIMAEDFFRRDHKAIYQSIERLAQNNSPFDVVTVSNFMQDIEEVGGLGYLADLARNTPSVANIKAYAVIVRDRAHLRRLMALGHLMTREAAVELANAKEVQESIEQRLFAMGQNHQKAEFIDVVSVLEKVVDQIDERFNSGDSVRGLPTGLTDFDELTGGLQDTDLIILAARPSMGKTSLALNFVDSALQKHPDDSVHIFSLEMPAIAILYRLIAVLGRLDLQKLLSGKLNDDDWPKLSYAMNRIKSYGTRLVIDDTSGLSPTELRARARRGARQFGKPRLIMVDYLQLMQCAGAENRTNEIAQISAALKGLAKEMNCPVVALSQLNRSLEQRPNKRPVNADLRESGALEQDADLIVFVYRDEVYHPETEHKGVAELILGKHRNGPIGIVRTAFIASQTRFENLSATYWQGASA
jgi:replicative DNA helicase